MVLIGILIGIAYMFVVFYFASEIDRKAYAKGILFDKKQAIKYALYCFLWPITMFIPKLWKI